MFLSRLPLYLFSSLLFFSPSFISADTTVYPQTGSAECTSNQSFGDLQSIIVSLDQQGTQVLTLSPNNAQFDPKTTQYTVTVDSSVTSVYLTLNGIESMQNILTRFDQQDWNIVDTGASQLLTLTGNGVTDQVYIFVDCNCHKTYGLTIIPANTGVRGDPQFTGLKGQSYQIHGIPNEYYNLITDSYIQYNSQFVFLTEGKCPIVDGKTVTGDCWTHPGTYLGEVGLKTSGGDRLHLVAGDRLKGFQSVSLNGKSLQIGDVVPITFNPNTGSSLPYNSFVNYTSTHSLMIEGAGFYSLLLTNSDWFVNQQITVLDWSAINSHGLLGQTWHKPAHKGQVKEIEGFVDDYLVLDHQLWGDNFLYNRFQLTEKIQQKQTRIVKTQNLKSQSK